MADDLVLDLVGAMRNASLGEVSEVVALLERQQKNRPAPSAHGSQATRSSIAPPAIKAQRATSESQPPNRRDAFEITMPSELLDSVTRTPVREDELPPASVRRIRPTSAPRRAPRAPRVLEPAAPAEPPRPPVVSLREGEQVVRASGSGVVIRRARTA